MSSDTATSFTSVLPFTLSAPAIARERLRRFAPDLSAGSMGDALLMVSELVTNAVMHGRPDVTLRLSNVSNRLMVGVIDLGDGLVKSALAEPHQTSGRGLAMVQALATYWGVDQTDGDVGKQVWFELDLI